MKDKIELDTVFDDRNIRIRFVIQFKTEYRSPYLFWDGFRTSLGRNFQAVTWHAILEDFFLLDIFRYRDDVMTILKTDWFNFKILMSGCDHKFTLSCVSFTNAISNKTETFTKSINMHICAICTLNQLFIRGSCTQIKFSKKWSSQWQKSFPFDTSILYSPFNLS